MKYFFILVICVSVTICSLGSVFIQDTILVPLDFIKVLCKSYVFLIHIALHVGMMVHLFRDLWTLVSEVCISQNSQSWGTRNTIQICSRKRGHLSSQETKRYRAGAGSKDGGFKKCHQDSIYSLLSALLFSLLASFSGMLSSSGREMVSGNPRSANYPVERERTSH